MKIAALIFLLNVVVADATIQDSDPVVVVSESESLHPRQPQAAIANDGSVYVAFGSGENIFCCRSTDPGDSFEDPIHIASVPKLALGKRRGPRIVAGNDYVVVTAISHESGNLLAWRSEDQGKTWSEPVQINQSGKSARERLHAMASSFGGNIYCVWLDLRNSKTELFGAASVDGGKTWSENRQVYRSPDGSICECCHPAVTYDNQENLHVMWRNSLEGYRDLYLAKSFDGGETFSKGQKLGTDGWKLDACPMDGGYLAVGGNQVVTTVWRRKNQIIRTDHESEQLLGVGEQPWAAAAGDGVCLVWVGQRNGDLFLSVPGEPESQKIAGHASDPVIVSSPDGMDPVIAFWESSPGKKMQIMAKVIVRKIDQ